jgi:predicted enzyme related to lactoylglutathione lyase
VAGIASVEREDPNEPIAQWLSYLRVADLDQVVGEVERAGGRVLVAPVTLEGVIRAAVVTDALGAPLGLVSFDEEVPVEPETSPLQPFLWRDYLAPDVDAALSFYEGVQGYDAERLSQPGGRAHYVFRGPGTSRPVGGLVGIGDAPVRASWLPYVKVRDPAALAERANELGGRVLLAPSPNVRNGGLAIVADPSGAPLALQKWPL